MSFGYSVGFMHVGFHFGGGYHYGWFGPPRYRPPYRPYYGGGYMDGVVRAYQCYHQPI